MSRKISSYDSYMSYEIEINDSHTSQRNYSQDKKMKRIQTYLDSSTADALAKFSEENGTSLSNAAGNIIREYFQRTNLSIGDNEMKAYFLRIINTLNQVLMCVYDKDKTSIDGQSAKECIDKITQQIQEGLGINFK